MTEEEVSHKREWTYPSSKRVVLEARINELELVGSDSLEGYTASTFRFTVVFTLAVIPLVTSFAPFVASRVFGLARCH
jgi:hypothetical protein